MDTPTQRAGDERAVQSDPAAPANGSDATFGEDGCQVDGSVLERSDQCTGATVKVGERDLDPEVGKGVFFERSQPRKVEWLVNAAYAQNSHAHRFASIVWINNSPAPLSATGSGCIDPTLRRVMPCSCSKGVTPAGLAEGGESCFGGVEVSLERSELGSGLVYEMGGCIVDIPGVGKTAFEPFDLAA